MQPANPNLRWETSRTVDASIEIGLWNDRVTTEIAYYNKRSKDVIMNVSTPPSTGFTNRWDNVATILNRGVEFSIKSRNLIGEFQWTTELNFARNYNELEDIGNYTPDAVSGGTNDSRVIPGSPVGSFYPWSSATWTARPACRSTSTAPATRRSTTTTTSGNTWRRPARLRGRHDRHLPLQAVGPVPPPSATAPRSSTARPSANSVW